MFEVSWSRYLSYLSAASAARAWYIYDTNIRFCPEIWSFPGDTIQSPGLSGSPRKSSNKIRSGPPVTGRGDKGSKPCTAITFQGRFTKGLNASIALTFFALATKEEFDDTAKKYRGSGEHQSVNHLLISYYPTGLSLQETERSIIGFFPPGFAASALPHAPPPSGAGPVGTSGSRSRASEI